MPLFSWTLTKQLTNLIDILRQGVTVNTKVIKNIKHK